MKTLSKLSITHCKRVLESGGKKYSEDEVEKIRDLLYRLGELEYLIYTEMKENRKNDKLDQGKAA